MKQKQIHGHREQICGCQGAEVWRRERLLTPVLWHREFHGLYSPWGHKESDTTEQLSPSHVFLI